MSVLPVLPTLATFLLIGDLGTLGESVFGIGLRPVDHPHDILQNLLGLDISHDTALDCTEFYLLVGYEVSVKFNGLAQLDGIAWEVD